MSLFEAFREEDFCKAIVSQYARVTIVMNAMQNLRHISGVHFGFRSARLLGWAGLILMGLLSLALPAYPEANADSPHVSIVKIDGVIDGVAARFLARGIEEAERDQAELLIIILDTPGGFLQAQGLRE